NARYSLAATYTLPGFTHGLAGLDSRYLIATYTEVPLLGGLASVAHAVKIDTTTGNIAVNTTLGANEPYSVSVMRGKVYVTVPAANQVIVLDNNLNPLKTLNVGRSPLSTCQDGSNLYVIDANSDDVAMINTMQDAVIAEFSVKFWAQNWGAGPTSCAVDGNSLYVTLSQANAVAVLDKTAGSFQGYIPAGWYPTKVLFAGGQLAVVSAKGIQPLRPNGTTGINVLNLLQGTIGFVNKASIAGNLFGWTLQVVSSAPFPVFPMLPSANIKHVFFVVKENRTFDQVLGDLGKGNGDPTLVNFGAAVTPIQHYLANEFVTLDNLYVDGEVSTTGHSITSSSYASPYLQLLTSLDYSNRLEVSSAFVPGGFSPSYIWDSLNAQNITYRIYGEAVYFQSLYLLVANYFGAQSELATKLQYLANPGEQSENVSTGISNLFAQHSAQTTTVSGMNNLLLNPEFGQPLSQLLTGDNSFYQAMQNNVTFLIALVNYLLHYQFNYSAFNLNVSDLDRVAAWMPDFQLKDGLGLVEQFQYLTLPNDHTGANSLGLSPSQQVAENDAALDVFLRTLVKSKVWPQSIVFVIEDDAQSGLDHVDATRTTGFVIGPWVKRGAVVSDRFDQLSMLRTAGILLGMPPISVNDAMAAPMFSIFSVPPTPPALGYTPPPVSSMLSVTDQQRYEQLVMSLTAN
ncbi:MAG: hypothetical protein JO336_20175, partial [Acidobacteriia bacterium]|nr:hypothetical protein [Terriglobia bacterium]